MEIHMISGLIFQWNRHIGVVHLQCILRILHEVSVRGRHILQGQRVIFSRVGLQRDLLSDLTCMIKELV
jgi:hypothetical protein